MRAIEQETLAFSFALILCLWCAGSAAAAPRKAMPVQASTVPVPQTGTTAVTSPSVAPEHEHAQYEMSRESAGDTFPVLQAQAPAPEPEAAEPPPSAPVEPEQAPAQPAPARPPRTYTVWLWQETGDCLWSLAERFYGDPWQWKKIYLANKDQIADPRVIYPKQVLVIPDADDGPQER